MSVEVKKRQLLLYYIFQSSLGIWAKKDLKFIASPVRGALGSSQYHSKEEEKQVVSNNSCCKPLNMMLRLRSFGLSFIGNVSTQSW